jgi:hypothetical protein
VILIQETLRDAKSFCPITKGTNFILIFFNNFKIFSIRYSIWLFLDDHLRITGFGNASDIEKIIKHVLILLENFDKNKILFSFDEKLGYLSEKALNLGFNMICSITMKVKRNLEETITVLAKKFGYSIRSDDIEEEPNYKTFQINSKRVSDFYGDIDFINEIIGILNSID